MTRVFDACALLDLLNNGDGKAFVRGALTTRTDQFYVHQLNLTEVYNRVIEDKGEAYAEAAMLVFQRLGISVRDDLEPEFCHTAAKWRAMFKMSLADAIGITLAQRLGGDFITCDWHELQPVAVAGAFPITFACANRTSKKGKRRSLEERICTTIQQLELLDATEGVGACLAERKTLLQALRAEMNASPSS